MSEELPRGAGLKRGTAGERRSGKPRTYEERKARHAAMFPKPPELPFTKGSSSNPGISDWLPAAPPNLPLPRFVVKQMKKE